MLKDTEESANISKIGVTARIAIFMGIIRGVGSRSDSERALGLVGAKPHRLANG